MIVNKLSEKQNAVLADDWQKRLPAGSSPFLRWLPYAESNTKYHQNMINTGVFLAVLSK